MDMQDFTFAELKPQVIDQIKAFESQLKSETNHQIVLLAFEKKPTTEVSQA